VAFVALLAIPVFLILSSDAVDPGEVEPIARQTGTRSVPVPPPAESPADAPAELGATETEPEPAPELVARADPPTLPAQAEPRSQPEPSEPADSPPTAPPAPAAIETPPAAEPESEPDGIPPVVAAEETIEAPPPAAAEETVEVPPAAPAPAKIDSPPAVVIPPPAPVPQPESAAPVIPPRSQAQLWSEARRLREARAYTSLVPVLEEIMAAHPADLEAAEWKRKSGRWIAKQSSGMREVLQEMLEDLSAYIDDREIQNIEEQFVGWLDASTRAYFDGLFRNNDGKIRSFPGAFTLEIVDGAADFTAEVRITAKPTKGAPFETIGTYLWSARLVRRDGDYLFEGSFP